MKRWQKKDPFYAREAQRYARPIPSREVIIRHLEERGVPLNLERLAADLGIGDEEQQQALSRRVGAMARDGQIIRNRRGDYVRVDRKELVAGRVLGHADGFGFLVPDEGGADIYLPPRQMRSLLHGDRAVVRVAGLDRRGRPEGVLVDILERNTHQVVGRFFREGEIGLVAPENSRLHQQIVVPPSDRGGAVHGQMVVVELVQQPDRHSLPLGKVVEVLGEHMAPGMETDVAIRMYELPHVWPSAVEEEVSGLGEEVTEAAHAAREDIRELSLVTIDGADARDFDDAVYCERSRKGWRLLVAIADVSDYVVPGTSLDAEAVRRGNSVYFPDRVLPMLPEVLSNGLCSLNPRVDRLCLVCELLITASGALRRFRFFKGVMRSAARLVYDDVAAALVRGPQVLGRHADLLPRLHALHEVYQALRVAREKRGAMDLDTVETRIVFGRERRIEHILPVERTVAHRIIEECMIAANVAAARFLREQGVPGLYRVHEGPTPDRVADLRTFLGELGLKLGGRKRPAPKHFAQILGQAAGRPDVHLIQTVLLRSLRQANYSAECTGHFGLALEAYAHFTSPIRRYPDLVVHRAIRHVLEARPLEQFAHAPAELASLGEHCSMTERRADEATRDAVEWLKCEFMQDKVGEVFDGMVTGVVSFGIFVELEGIYVQGLVHVTSLGDDYYHFDPARHRLWGQRSRQTYGLADRVRVRVMRVDLDERKIDFEMVRSPKRHRGDKSAARG
jgi:ribonuclease R